MSEHSRQELEYRLRQQALITELGLFALKGPALDTLLQEATRIAAEGTAASFAKVLEHLPGENTLLVRAGVGWKKGVVGKATIGADLESPAGYALQTGQPVISNSLPEEERFRTPRLLRDHGIERAVNVIVQGTGKPFGVLEVDSPDGAPFTREDTNFLQALANVLGIAIERQRVEQVLRDMAAERQTLLLEMNHRVKNNLQLVSSLIELEAARIADPVVKRKIGNLTGRVNVLSRVHEQLYRFGQAEKINFGRYLVDLSNNLVDLHGTREGPVRLETEVGDVDMPLDRAIPLALIVNELVSNSLKHGFPEGRQGTVRIVLQATAGEPIRLTISDDGQGIDVIDQPSEGFGRRLVKGLAEQIGATVTTRSGNGLEVTIVLAPENGAA